MGEIRTASDGRARGERVSTMRASGVDASSGVPVERAPSGARPPASLPRLLRALRRHPLVLVVLAFACYDFTYGGLWLSGILHGATADRLTGAMAIPAAGVVIFVGLRLRGSMQWDDRSRRGWTMVAVGIGSYGLGYAVLFAAGTIDFAPLSWLGVAFELATYPLVGFGLSQLARPFERTSDGVAAWLDVLIIAWSTAMIVWHFALYPVARDAHAAAADVLVASFGPVGDLTLVFAIAAVMLRGPRSASQRALGIGAAALVCLFAGDVVAGMEELRGTYAIGGLSGVFYGLAWLGLAVAAVLQSVHSPATRIADAAPYRRIVQWVPYVAVFVAFVGPAIYHWTDTELLEQHIPATGLLMALLVARLMVTARQNAAFAAGERVRLSAAMEQAAEAVVLADRDGKIGYANSATSRMSGLEMRELIGQDLDILRGDDDSQLPEMRRAVARGENWHGRLVRQTPDGPLEIDVTASPVRDKAGQPEGAVLVGRDITRERALEAQLAQTQRMEAVGRLAGGVAHDFNNVLTAISGFTELALYNLPDDHPVATDLREVMRASDRAAGLTRDLLAFSQRQVMKPRLIDLNEVIEGIRSMLERTLGEDIALRIRAQGGLGGTIADPSQIEQVVLNLVANARDAMPNGGMLTITTADADLSQAYAASHPGTMAGQFVTITIADTGTGMPPEVLEHIFMPFFTTKKGGASSGLGLATVAGIVQQSGGFVLADSAVGSGSVFSVFLPRVLPMKVEEPVDAPVIAGGNETILVAEDEAPVRRVIERVLKAAGYRVYVAGTGHEAIAMAPTLPHLDLLLTDVVMPGMSGVDLARQLVTRRPDLRVIFASGYTGDSLIRAGAKENVPFLDKPFAAETLRARVRQVLDSPVENPFE